MKNKIAKEIKEQVLARVKSGVPVITAAADAGISIKTVYGWLRWQSSSTPPMTKVSRLEKENKHLYELVGKLTSRLHAVKKGIW
jgi:hypothetical protein